MEGMILAAGLGTRLHPITLSKPKALVEVVSQTLLEIAIRRMTKAGCKRIVINVHHFAELIQSFVSKHTFGAELVISDETECLLDTGGGLKKAENLFSKNQPILVHNVDIISNIDFNDLLCYHLCHNSIATLAVSDRSTSRYFLFDNKSHLQGWTNINTGQCRYTSSSNSVEHKLNPLAFSGVQIIHPLLFDFITPNKKQSLVDVYLDVGGCHPVVGYLHSSKGFIDVGKPETIAQAEAFLRLNNPGD